MKGLGVIVCAIAALGCGVRRPIAGVSSDGPSDATVRAAVIRMIADSARYELHVDSLPLALGLDLPDGRAVPTSSDMRGSGGMDELGDIWGGALRSMPDTMRHHCAGIMVPDDPRDPIYANNRSGCPKTNMLVVVLGQPRHPTISQFASLRAIAPIPDSIAQLRVVNVLETQVGPSGRATGVAEYVIAARRGAWVLVKRKVLLYVE